MNVSVITPCVYPDMRPIHYLTESCLRNGIALRPHGVGQPYADWRSMLMRYTLPHMKEIESEGGTHVLYVDGVDSIFLAGLDEIIAKYERHFGSGISVISSDWDQSPHGNFTGMGPWRFLNAGGYITPIRPWVELMESLEKKYPEEGNYQVWLEKEWPIIGCSIDLNCRIFQSMDGKRCVFPVGPRVFNSITGTYPCILHFRGGYCDPATGRDERMKPWVEALTR